MPTFALGNDGENGGGTSLISAVYHAYAVSPRLRIGVGLSPILVTKPSMTKTSQGGFLAILLTSSRLTLTLRLPIA